MNAATRTENGKGIERKDKVKTKNALETGNERKAATGKLFEGTEVVTRIEPSTDLNLVE